MRKILLHSKHFGRWKASFPSFLYFLNFVLSPRKGLARPCFTNSCRTSTTAVNGTFLRTSMDLRPSTQRRSAQSMRALTWCSRSASGKCTSVANSLLRAQAYFFYRLSVNPFCLKRHPYIFPWGLKIVVFLQPHRCSLGVIP